MAAKKAKAAAPAPTSMGVGDPATQRVLTACSSITSVARTAVAQATESVTPFLSFAQRSRIGALAVNFDARVTGQFGAVALPTPRPTAAPVTGGEGGLSRDEVDGMIAHRVEIALTEALQRIGMAPSSTLSEQIDNRIGGQVSDQESRILDYVRTQLADSLRIFEERLDERLGEFETARRDEKVDEQLEQAREDLLKNIDEVRTVDVSADTYTFAAGIVEVDGTTGLHPSAEDDEIVSVGDEVDEVVAAAADEEVEDKSLEDGVEAEAYEGEVEQAERAAEGQDTDAVLDLESEDFDEVDIDEVEEELVKATGDVTVNDDIEIADIDLDVDIAEEDIVNVAGDEALEEISVVQPFVKEVAADGELPEIEIDSIDLHEVATSEADEDDVGLMTLGEGPDEIRVPDEEDDKVDDELDIEIDIDEPVIDEKDGPKAAINKYMDRATQMGSRQQLTAALELYSKVLEIDGSHFDALVSRGVIYSKMKDYRKASEDFRQAREIAPERAGSFFGLAELHYNRRQFNEAIKNYSLALERDNQLAEAYCRRGLSYYYLKNYKVAFHDLYKAYDINPDLPKIRSFLKLVQSKIKEAEGQT